MREREKGVLGDEVREAKMSTDFVKPWRFVEEFGFNSE